MHSALYPKPNQRGFTLVELLVVISIIAILSVIGMTIFSDTQKKGRDARRKLDINAIATVLETSYNSSTGLYPTSLDPTKFAGGASPQDPTNSGEYTYNNIVSTTGTGFTTCVKMESGSGGNSANNAFTASGTTYYCRKSQQ